jgi:hypothetical protein
MRRFICFVLDCLIGIDWIFDYYIAYFTYKTDKLDRYHNYMIQKWGKKYTDRL